MPRKRRTPCALPVPVPQQVANVQQQQAPDVQQANPDSPATKLMKAVMARFWPLAPQQLDSAATAVAPATATAATAAATAPAAAAAAAAADPDSPATVQMNGVQTRLGMSAQHEHDSAQHEQDGALAAAAAATTTTTARRRDESEDDGLVPYERERDAIIARNKAVMAALGIPGLC
jgi:hypothetical protein